MTKFNATQFTKHGFVHLKDEDFTDDGSKFQIWQHEESGLKVSYSRYTYTNGDGEKETEYFVSPRESYYSYGLLYSDVSDEPEWEESCKFNGCFEVDVEELVGLLKARHDMMLRVKERVDAEEIDMTPVFDRAEEERREFARVLAEAKSVRWWELDKYKLELAARDIKSIEGRIAQLDKILRCEIDRRKQRELAHSVKDYGYVVDRLDDGSEFSSYNTLRKLLAK